MRFWNAILATLVLCGLAGSQETEIGPEGTLVRDEAFRLAFVGATEPMGTAALRERCGPDGERLVEFVWNLQPIQTRIDRFVRTRGGRTTVSYREWRASQERDRFTGRTLVMERRAGVAELREWAGGEMQVRYVAPGLDELELIAASRKWRGAGLRVVSGFSSLEGTTRPLWLQRVELPLPMAGMPPAARVFAWDLELGRPVGEWLFVGQRLTAFRMGEVVGTAIKPLAQEAIEVSAGSRPGPLPRALDATL